MNVIVIICLVLTAVTLACGRSMNITRCLSKSDATTVQISCSTSELILLINEYKGRTYSEQTDFCHYPKPGANDCRLQTNNFVESCSTFSSCTQHVKYDSITSCGGNQGHVYMHVDYQCINRKQDEENSGDIHFAAMSKQDEHSGVDIYMMSSGYGAWSNDTLAYCTVSVPAYNSLTITIYDFSASHHRQDCISWLNMKGQDQVCANVNWQTSTLSYRERTTQTTIDMVFWSREAQTSRLWMLLQSSNGGSLNVKCGLDTSSIIIPTTTTSRTTSRMPASTSSTRTSESSREQTSGVAETTTSAAAHHSSDNTSINLVAVIAGVVAATVVILIIIIIIVCLIARNKKLKEPEREVIDAWKSNGEANHMVAQPPKHNGKPTDEAYTIYNNANYDQVGDRTMQQQTSFEEKPTEMYAKPSKKSRPQPAYDNAAFVRNEDQDAVYGYSRELPEH